MRKKMPAGSIFVLTIDGAARPVLRKKRGISSSGEWEVVVKVVLFQNLHFKVAWGGNQVKIH